MFITKKNFPDCKDIYYFPKKEVTHYRYMFYDYKWLDNKSFYYRESYDEAAQGLYCINISNYNFNALDEKSWFVRQNLIRYSIKNIFNYVVTIYYYNKDIISKWLINNIENYSLFIPPDHSEIDSEVSEIFFIDITDVIAFKIYFGEFKMSIKNDISYIVNYKINTED